jgi:proline iminopeptidase
MLSREPHDPLPDPFLSANAMPPMPLPVDALKVPGLPGATSAPTGLEALAWQALPLADGAGMAWCEGGDPQGLPVLVIHGGPGGHTRWPSLQWWQGLPVRWIAYDQRGCGRSTPRGSLVGNALPQLLADIEALREHLTVPCWAVAAGSWGSLLALAYAAWQPQRVRGLFLRSSFMGSQPELQRYMAPWFDWLGEAGREALGAPAVALWQLLCQRETSLCEPGSGATPGGVVAGAMAMEQAQAQALATAWSAFDAAQRAPGGVVAGQQHWRADLPALDALGWLDWGIFLHHARSGWGVPAQGVAPGPWPGACWLVHGEDDAVCDPAVSARLAQHWPQAHWVRVAGGAHAMSQPPMGAALQQAAVDWVAALG